LSKAGPGPARKPQAGALTHWEALTPLGAVLSLLPVDVHTGKLLVLGGLLGLQEPAITMAAALAVQSPFVRLSESQQEAGILERRRELMSPWGDPFTLLEVDAAAAFAAAAAAAAAAFGAVLGSSCTRPGPDLLAQVFEAWLAIKSGLSRQWSSSSKWAKAHGLQEQRLYEMAKLKRQFAELLEDAGGWGGGPRLQQLDLLRWCRQHAALEAVGWEEEACVPGPSLGAAGWAPVASMVACTWWPAPSSHAQPAHHPPPAARSAQAWCAQLTAAAARQRSRARASGATAARTPPGRGCRSCSARGTCSAAAAF
jgi:hypothetical protein